MFVFLCIALCAVVTALAVSTALTLGKGALAKSRRARVALTALSALVSAGGIVAAAVAAHRFSQIESYNEWAINAFRTFVDPTSFAVIVSVLVLAASVATDRRRVKTVICLAASALFAVAVTSYTALFSLLSEHPTSYVQTYVRASGLGFAAVFAIVPAVAGAKRIVVDAIARKRSKDGKKQKNTAASAVDETENNDQEIK